MKIAITGASGLVGRGFVAHARALGDQVIPLSRPDFDLAKPAPSLTNVNVLIHAGFAHVPGKYRGGEGDDPDEFTKLNRDGTIRLFERAAQDGVGGVVFLSSRAVYGTATPGEMLLETRPPQPDTLYGQIKFEVEQALFRLDVPSVSLRSTGVYGPGAGHKWTDLFQTFLAGRPVAPRVGTEVHVIDLADAARRALSAGVPMVNVSDILVDRHDLLTEVARLSGRALTAPARGDAALVNVADCSRLRALGWAPRGWSGLKQTLPQMLLHRPD